MYPVLFLLATQLMNMFANKCIKLLIFPYKGKVNAQILHILYNLTYCDRRKRICMIGPILILKLSTRKIHSASS